MTVVLSLFLLLALVAVRFYKRKYEVAKKSKQEALNELARTQRSARESEQLYVDAKSKYNKVFSAYLTAKAKLREYNIR